MNEHVGIEFRGPVCRIRLERVEVRNALGIEMLEDLLDSFQRAESSTNSITVLTGEGPCFCSGMDLKNTNLENPQTASRFANLLAETYASILFHPKPVFCVVEGPTLGGGVGLALSADVVWVGPKARFAFPETRLGLVPALVSVPLKQRVSSTVARSLLLTGDWVSSEAALRVGLADRYADHPESEVMEYAISFDRSHSIAAVSRTKRFLNRVIESNIRLELEAACEEFQNAVSSRVAREGLRSFRSGEKTDWSEDNLRLQDE